VGKRRLYSRIARRLRHIADGDELRGLKKRTLPPDPDAPRPAPLLAYLQPAAAVLGAAAILALVAWLVANLGA
jgi:hypothetical protein